MQSRALLEPSTICTARGRTTHRGARYRSVSIHHVNVGHYRSVWWWSEVGAEGAGTATGSALCSHDPTLGIEYRIHFGPGYRAYLGRDSW